MTSNGRSTDGVIITQLTEASSKIGPMSWGMWWLVEVLGGLEESTWIELWSGAVGAIPASILSAVAAAWVAVSVLTRTNRHQQVLEERATAAQRDIASAQLAEQRRLTELQLQEQRRDSSQARERDAMASVAVAAYGFVDAYEISNDEVAAQLQRFRTAVMRLELELGNSHRELGRLLWGYGNILLEAGLAIAVDKALGRDAGRRSRQKLVHRGVAVLHVFFIGWQEGHKAIESLENDVRALRAELAAIGLQDGDVA